MTSPHSRQGPNRAAIGPRRAACVECRERKVRCSGTQPCNNCLRRSSECFFEQEKKIVVSERYLNELKRKAEGDYRESNSPRSNRRPTPSEHESSRADIERDDERGSTEAFGEPFKKLKNPLVADSPSFLTDSRGKRRFLGPSSTWAYSRHAMNIIREHLGEQSSTEVPLNLDGTAFPLETATSEGQSTTVVMDNLPSFDYAIHLSNSVKFHITQTYHLFDETTFTNTLDLIYKSEAQTLDPQHSLEYIQYLVVMALGKGLIGRARPNSQPPGIEYFKRASQVFPDMTALCRDPVLSVEICCGMALYLQSIDHRNTAYLYLGLGLRASLSQGLHRDLAGGYFNSAEEARHRSAWWTLYILDRKFSSLMGAPSSINDNDISVPLPDERHSTQKSKVVDVHVKLSQLIAKVLNTVYASNDRLDSSFLGNIQIILRELAKLGDDLAASSDSKPGSSSPVSRVSATVSLCYHQCILLAIRPLLVCLLRGRLEDKVVDGSSNRHIVEPITALLTTAHDSAMQSLRILSDLQSHDLLETFLPFDLEQIFSSGFIITLISAIHPSPTAADDNGFERTLELLDTLIVNWNIPARFRKEELVRLREMLLLVRQRESQQDDGNNDSLEFPDAMPYGLSPNQILSIADLLDSYPDIDTMIGTGSESWL